MFVLRASDDLLMEDCAPLSRAPWLTWRRITLFVLGWLGLLTLISVLVSNPYMAETSALATPDYFRVMFLHGLLVGMVGLGVLMICQIIGCGSRRFRAWIAGGVLVGTILATLGGTFNRSLGGSELALWTQVLSFLAMDVTAVVMLAAATRERWRRSPRSRTLPFATAVLSGTSMLIAGAMGSVMGWVMKYGGGASSSINGYLEAVGFTTVDRFLEALRLSHSHQMAMGVMGLAVALLSQQFGYGMLQGRARAVTQAGLIMVAVGTAAMTAIYLLIGFAGWQPPYLFSSSPSGPSGIPAHDAVTGVLVVGGGVVALGGLGLGRLIRAPIRWAAAWSWVASFALVVLVGYYIQLHEGFFGAGNLGAPGAEQDALFTWLHQGFGLFLLPAMVLEMLVAERLVKRGHPALIGWATMTGVSVVFAGSLIWLFVDPALYGPGYFVSATGLLIMGAGLLATLWWGRGPSPDRTKLASIRQSGDRGHA
jgi:hypothetical protein